MIAVFDCVFFEVEVGCCLAQLLLAGLLGGCVSLSGSGLGCRRVVQSASVAEDVVVLLFAVILQGRQRYGERFRNALYQADSVSHEVQGGGVAVRLKQDREVPFPKHLVSLLKLNALHGILAELHQRLIKLSSHVGAEFNH
jgi:hypothetical protein